MSKTKNGALRVRFGMFVFMAGVICSPASASSIFILPSSALVVASASFPVGSQCLQLAYDRNGNRLSRSSSVISTTSASWGASVYGCSRWG